MRQNHIRQFHDGFCTLILYFPAIVHYINGINASLHPRIRSDVPLFQGHSFLRLEVLVKSDDLGLFKLDLEIRLILFRHRRDFIRYLANSQRPFHSCEQGRELT